MLTERYCLSNKLASKTYNCPYGCANGACRINPCAPNWQCSAWSTCINGKQTRKCSDINNCGSNIGKPSETQSCKPGSITISFNNWDSIEPMTQNQNSSWIIPSHDICFPNDTVCNSALYVTRPYPANSVDIYLNKSLSQFNKQSAEIQFKTDDISGHLILAVQGDFGPDFLSGYFAFIGREQRFPDLGMYISIEKAIKGWNYLLNPVRIGDKLNSNSFYSIKINSIKYQDRVEINAKLFEYLNGSWNFIKETSYTDYNNDKDGDFLGGQYSYFGAFFQDNNVYWDNYIVSWR